MTGIFNGNETQKTQRIILLLDVSEKPQYNIPQIAATAGVKLGIAKKTLGTADCIEVNRTGGPIVSRSEDEAYTVRKTFDSITELESEGPVPIKCRRCKFANIIRTTEFRKRKTVGCLILNQRAKEMETVDE